MLNEMLRALGVYLSNEQLTNAVAEVIEEDIRTRRISQYLQYVKKGHPDKRYPPPLDSSRNIVYKQNQNDRIFPHYFDIVQDDPKWDEDIEKNETFEQSLWEAIGLNEITLGLDDFVRILVNYRKISRPLFSELKYAFEILGAKGGLMDKTKFTNALTTYGEPFVHQDLTDAINILSEKGAVGGLQLPDHITAEEFATKYLNMEVDDAAGAVEEEEQEAEVAEAV